MFFWLGRERFFEKKQNKHCPPPKGLCDLKLPSAVCTLRHDAIAAACCLWTMAAMVCWSPQNKYSICSICQGIKIIKSIDNLVSKNFYNKLLCIYWLISIWKFSIELKKTIGKMGIGSDGHYKKFTFLDFLTEMAT